MTRRVAIRVEHLVKTFQSQTQATRLTRAVNDLSLDVYEGEVLGVLGPNGAGKTTFLNMLATLLLPDSGQISVLGIPSRDENFSRLRRLINMSSGYPNYPWCLTVEENLRFYGQLYGLAGTALKTKVSALMDLFRLEDYAKVRFDELSSGTKQRLSLAKCLLNDPKIVFLDEPTVGLDPDVAQTTREVVKKILRDLNITVLFTTHNMNEAEELCDRIAFIKQGSIVKLASPQELKQVLGKQDLEEVFITLARSQSEAGGNVLNRDSGLPLASTTLAGDPLGLMRIKAWCRRTLAFTYRNVIFAMRNIFFLVELAFWPLVTLISIGLMGKYLQLESQAFAFVLTGAIAGGVLQVTQLDVAYSLLYDVWSKSMKHTMLTPVGVTENLFGSWLVGIVRGLIVFAVLSVTAQACFGFHFPGLRETIVFLGGICCFAMFLGLLVSLLILRFGQKAEITAWMFAYLFMLVCGIYYPVEILPSGLMGLAQAIPLTYFLEYFRAGYGFHPLFAWGVAKGFGLLALYFVIGVWALRQSFHAARRKGIIVRLSE